MKKKIITSKHLAVIEQVDALIAAGVRQQTIADAAGVDKTDMSHILNRNSSRIDDAKIDAIATAAKKISAKIGSISQNFST